ncbi:MAG: 50S ribosomal protein L29 [Clostridiales bacterium]|jgi:large subunit ribosomal protein L29|nr:50S ribosomal protein L29 [Clostridiales bacterium]
MKAKEVHDMTNDELNAKLSSLKSELFYLRFNHAVGQLGNTNQLKAVKRDIARIKTVLREREIKGISGPASTPAKKKA